MRLFKSLRFYLRLLTALTKKYYPVILLGLTSGILLALGVTFLFGRFKNNHQQTVRRGLVGQYTISNLPDEILNRLSFGLTKIQPNGEITAGVADKWLVNPDGKQYEFFIIPEKYTWANGQPFSIKAINYSFQDVIITTTDRSIIYQLTEEFAPLPSVLAKPLFLSQLNGLGDYKLLNYHSKGNIIDSISLKYVGNSQNQDIIYRFYPTLSDLVNGFNLGEIDYIENLSSPKNVAQGERVSIEPYTNYHIFTALYFNTDKPEFTEKSIRQALAYALTKPTDEKRAFSSYSPYSWVYNINVKPYLYDINRTFEIVKEEDLVKTRELTISVFPQDVDLAAQVVNDLKAIGIKSKTLTISVLPDDFDLLIVSRQIPLEADQYYYWHSTQAGNLSKMRNPRLDKLLEDGRRTTDRETRKNIYLDFQRYLLEECPAVFISHPTMYRVIRT